MSPRRPDDVDDPRDQIQRGRPEPLRFPGARWLISGLALALIAAAASAQGTYPLSVPPPEGAPKPVHQIVRIAARDDVELSIHRWTPAEKPAPNKPVIVFIHGIALHGEPYGSIAAGFTSHGLTFIAPDLRGHGRSDGPRGELPRPHVLRADIGAVIAFVKERHPEAPVVLAGESMGGLIAADYAWRGESRLAGLALLAPAFAVHPSQLKKVDLKDVLAALAGPIAIATEEKLAPSTRDKRFIKARQADKLAHSEVALSYLSAILELQKEWPTAAAELRAPLFVAFGGKDVIVEAKVARTVFDGAATPKKDKTWLEWKDARHTLCWDPDTPQVIEEMAQWVLKRAPDPPKKAK